MAEPGAGSVILGRGGMIVTRTSAGSNLLGASNGGYWGISTMAGAALRFGIDCFSGSGTPVVLRLVAPDGKEIGHATAVPSAAYSMVRGAIDPTASTSDAHLEVGLEQAGQVNIKSVSLIPEKTFKGHGLRRDLASMVSAIHPAFVRFPGGCYVEGQHLADAPAAGRRPSATWPSGPATGISGVTSRATLWATTSTSSSARTSTRSPCSSSIAASLTSRRWR